MILYLYLCSEINQPMVNHSFEYDYNKTINGLHVKNKKYKYYRRFVHYL